jgi:RNA exonuclease 1
MTGNMQDSGGRLQKNVLMKRDNGDVVNFFIRKMVYGSQPNQLEVTKKRQQPTEDAEPKKEHAEGDQRKKKRKSKKHVN